MPLFPKEELCHIGTKYSDWAPEPWSKLPPRPTVLGPLPGESPPLFFRVMQVVSGLEDLLAIGKKPTTLERSFKSMKSKVVPLWSI